MTYRLSNNCDNLEELLDFHAQAMGGLISLNEVETVYMKGEQEEHDAIVEYHRWLLVGRAMRCELRSADRHEITVLTRNYGWRFNSQLPAPHFIQMAEQEVKALQHSMDLTGPLINPEKKNVQLRLLPSYPDETGFYLVEVSSGKKIKMYYQIDAFTGMVQRVYNEQEDVGINVQYGNYVRVENEVPFPLLIKTELNEKDRILIRFSDIKVNQPLDEKMFLKPVESK